MARLSTKIRPALSRGGRVQQDLCIHEYAQLGPIASKHRYERQNPFSCAIVRERRASPLVLAT
eukprot:14491442-Alexandrium_andersonii.AAC.1